MYTQYLHHSHPPSPFPHLLPPSHGYQPHPSTVPVLPTCSPILFKKGKRKK
jgi:hypothetical protein